MFHVKRHAHGKLAFAESERSTWNNWTGDGRGMFHVEQKLENWSEKRSTWNVFLIFKLNSTAEGLFHVKHLASDAELC